LFQRDAARLWPIRFYDAASWQGRAVTWTQATVQDEVDKKKGRDRYPALFDF